MTMLKSIASHLTCSFIIQDYLERGDSAAKRGQNLDRAIAKDFINLYGDMQRNWAYQMDKTRTLSGNDTKWRGKDAITYQHFIISPAPKDACDIDTLRSLTMQWVREMFGSETEPGRFGSYEVAIVYHNDNTRHIPHAHVIVNNTNLENGKRLQIHRNKDTQYMANRLQEISEEHGLSYFDNSELEKMREVPSLSGARLTKTERALQKQKKYSWKQDLRNMIQIAWRTTSNRKSMEGVLAEQGVRAVLKTDFIIACDTVDFDVLKATFPQTKKTNYSPSKTSPETEAIVVSGRGRAETKEIETILNQMGAKIEKKTEDYIFAHHKNPTRWQVSGYKLGRGYTASSLQGHQIDARIQGKLRDDTLKENVMHYLKDAKVSAIIPLSVTLKEASFVLKTNDRYNLYSLKDYETHIEKLQKQVQEARETGTSLQGIEMQINDLKRAYQTAQKGDFFVGVKPPEKKKTNLQSTMKLFGSDDSTPKTQDRYEYRSRSVTHTQTQSQPRGRSR